ncbi:hypothetical protein SAMN04488055_5453 [Chitinophaga niabensis]|uniref:Uncharacterized protein n=1 Tax=Chitinophaga niabensis TaxID=536979 RepID=A0A1N6KAS9_9BACT|nr:hypothetical protein SAMN04488055_5453 [Chitinophaga niabensis]
MNLEVNSNIFVYLGRNAMVEFLFVQPISRRDLYFTLEFSYMD